MAPPPGHRPADVLPVVFLHGVGGAGPAAWPQQAGLVEERTCTFVERGVPGDNPDHVIPALLESAPPRFHLVGHSYGAVTALLVATHHPCRVASLTLIEPAAFALSADEPYSAAHIAAMQAVFERADDPAVTTEQFAQIFAEGMGLPAPEAEDAGLERLVTHLRSLRPPWTLEVDPTVPERIPTLVIVGDSHPMYAEVGAALARGGAEVVHRGGAGHRPHDEPEVTELMRRHWDEAETIRARSS